MTRQLSQDADSYKQYIQNYRLLGTINEVLIGERIEMKVLALHLESAVRIKNHARGKSACAFHPDHDVYFCVTDFIENNWRLAGLRVMIIDPNSGRIYEKIFSEFRPASSYLWGDFNNDSHLDFIAFRSGEEGDGPRVEIALGQQDGSFIKGQDISFQYNSTAGGVLDANNDGCEDVLVLGSYKGTPPNETGEPDALFSGNCKGQFSLSNVTSGLDRYVGFLGHPQMPFIGRTSAFTDLNHDGCMDIVIGNYRGQRNQVLISDCSGKWSDDPQHRAVGLKRTYYGHTVGLHPSDINADGFLDLLVANLQHSDERGNHTDPAHMLLWNPHAKAFDRKNAYYDLEAPFGTVVVDLNGDLFPEIFYATGTRWGNYTGKAEIWSKGIKVWQEQDKFINTREIPSVADLNLDGAWDFFSDGVIRMNKAKMKNWVGVIFESSQTLIPSGVLATAIYTNGKSVAHVFAQDGRGAPSNVAVFFSNSEYGRPVTLDLIWGKHKKKVDVSNYQMGQYFTIQLD